MSGIKKHFVIFVSPGTFVSETSEREIDDWDVPTALKMMKTIIERHNARPFGFRFITRGRGPNDLDSKQIAKSKFYFVNCDVVTAEKVMAGTDPDEGILRSNIMNNRIKRLARPRSGWQANIPMEDEDEAIDM